MICCSTIVLRKNVKDALVRQSTYEFEKSYALGSPVQFAVLEPPEHDTSNVDSLVTARFSNGIGTFKSHLFPTLKRIVDAFELGTEWYVVGEFASDVA